MVHFIPSVERKLLRGMMLGLMKSDADAKTLAWGMI